MVLLALAFAVFRGRCKMPGRTMKGPSEVSVVVKNVEMETVSATDSDWVDAIDAGSGRRYYYNQKTGETRW